jgi:hypothetical protein
VVTLHYCYYTATTTTVDVMCCGCCCCCLLLQSTRVLLLLLLLLLLLRVRNAKRDVLRRRDDDNDEKQRTRTQQIHWYYRSIYKMTFFIAPLTLTTQPHPTPADRQHSSTYLICKLYIVYAMASLLLLLDGSSAAI